MENPLRAFAADLLLTVERQSKRQLFSRGENGQNDYKGKMYSQISHT